MMYTMHAKMRTQQRAIPPLVVDWLLHYGEENHNHDGAVRRHFSKQTWRALERDVGAAPLQRLRMYRNAYLVEAGGKILTVGYRTKREHHR